MVGEINSLDTMTGLRTGAPSFAVRKIKSSEAKWPKAIRYVNMVMS